MSEKDHAKPEESEDKKTIVYLAPDGSVQMKFNKFIPDCDIARFWLSGFEGLIAVTEDGKIVGLILSSYDSYVKFCEYFGGELIPRLE